MAHMEKPEQGEPQNSEDEKMATEEDKNPKSNDDPMASEEEKLLKTDDEKLAAAKYNNFTRPINKGMSLRVLGQDNSEMLFRIKKFTPLKKLMHTYCLRTEISMKVVRFRFDGHPVGETDTPASLEMEDGDTIEIYLQQIGGSE